ncbi:MAG: hypothetical protein ACP5NX_01885 [Candidatus Bilamarchaeaceae archaeon]
MAEKNQKKDGGKGLPVVPLAIVAVLAIMAIYVLFVMPKPSGDASKEAFIANLVKAPKVAIVADIGGADDIVGRNIMQCFVDYTSGLEMNGKNTTRFVVMDNLCYTQDGKNTTRSSCISQAQATPYIYIERDQGRGYRFTDNSLTVEIGANYTYGACTVSTKTGQ